jgi:hypothetical protein
VSEQALAGFVFYLKEAANNWFTFVQQESVTANKHESHFPYLAKQRSMHNLPYKHTILPAGLMGLAMHRMW